MAILNGIDTERITEIVETVKRNLEAGKTTTWNASTSWKGSVKVETRSRGHKLMVDEPEMLGGTNTAANPVEMLLQAYGACLTMGYVIHSALRGIKIDDVEIDLEGELEVPAFLPGFLGLEPKARQTMDKLPGFKTITANVKIKADADAEKLQDLNRQVTAVSPVGLSLSRPVKLVTNIEAWDNP